MKTILTPPPITPGPWHIGDPQTYATYNANKINSEKVGICEVYGIPLHSSLEEVEKDKRSKVGLATAKFIAAAPAMAEVLVKYHSDLMWRAENILSMEDSKWALAAAGEMETSLLAAGYTITTEG